MVAHREGDPHAFNTLFRRYSPMLLRVMRRGVNSEADAQDLVQQTFLQMHRARAAYQPSRPLRPWLLTIAMNLKRTHWRRVGRKRQAPAEAGVEAPAEVDVLRKERARQLHHALRQLPANQRSVIELHWLEEIPMAEVGEILGVSRNAVKVRAHRGYKRLRTLLADEGETPA